MPNQAVASQAAKRFLGARVPGFLTRSGRVYSMVYGPEEGDWEGVGWSYTEQSIQGQRPLVYPNSPQPGNLTFTHTIADPPGFPAAHRDSARNAVQSLEALRNSGEMVRLIGTSGREQRGWWVITGMKVHVDLRDARQEPLSVTISWTLRSADPNTRVPKIGRSARAAVISTPKPGNPKASTVQKSYTVKAGQSLLAIAQITLGDATRWGEIARLNKLADPNVIAVGTVLKIPAS